MDALSFCQRLVSFESTSTLTNVPVTDFVEVTLRELGFVTERVEYDDERGVRKASVVGRRGEGPGGMAYFGHTDVVPADNWFSAEHGPFTPAVVEGRLYGRGSCDMKGSVACMLAAAARLRDTELRQPLYITCTADEEIGYGGAQSLVERSELYREMVRGETRGIIGEPTRLDVVYAHKGTYGFEAIARGRAAHSSTREGINANLAMIPFLVEMKRIHDQLESDPAWQDERFDPPIVSWNIGINDHTRAVNITPPQSVCTVYFRPMPGQNSEALLDQVRQAAENCGIELHLKRCYDAMYTDPDSPLVRETLELAGRERARTVAYGTDGAVLQEMKQLVICGPGDIAQAHTRDEWIALEQLELGTELYARMIQRWCRG